MAFPPILDARMKICRLLCVLGAVMAPALALAQKYPSPIYKNVTVQGSVSASSFQSGDASTLTVLEGSTARSLSTRFNEVVNAADYGAKCDGVTDDTAAFANAIAAAEARIVSIDYWMPSGLPEVSVLPGVCMTSGIVIHKAIWFHGAGASSTTFVLRAGSNVSTVKVAADAQADPTPWAGHTQPKLSDFAIDGNSSNQTGTSHGIEVADAPYTQGMRYGSGVRISDIDIYGVKSHGVYIGKNRNFGWIDRVIVNYAQNNCISFSGANDWDLNGISVGACAWNGLDFYYSSQIKIVNADIYNNTGSAIKVGAGFGGYIFVSNSTLGANCANGVDIEPGSVTQSGYIGFANVQITDNSVCANNSNSHFYVRKFPNLVLSNVWFYYQGSGNNAKYVIDNDSVSPVAVSNLTIASGSTTPYVTAPFATPSLVTGTVNGVPYGAVSSCSGTPASSFTVTNGIVTHC
jgi:hypothetical protein